MIQTKRASGSLQIHKLHKGHSDKKSDTDQLVVMILVFWDGDNALWIAIDTTGLQHMKVT